MIGPIQRDARGILRFLDIVGQTERPRLLEDAVRGVVDMIPFYGANQLETRRLTGNVQNPGDTVALAVPANEAWYMVAGQFGVAGALVGESVACSYRITVPAAVGTAPVPIRVASFALRTAAAAAAVELLDGVLFPQPFIMLPGWQIDVNVDDSTLAAARTGAIAAICYPFTV